MGASARTLGIFAATASMGLLAQPATAGQVRAAASTSIVAPLSVSVVSEAPMQALAVTGDLARSGVTFTADAAESSSVAVAGFVGGSSSRLMINGSGLITGTTMNGEALSVSIGRSIGNVRVDSTTGANSGISVVVAQYN